MDIESRKDNSIEIKVISGSGSVQELSHLLNSSFNLRGEENFLDDFPIWNPSLLSSSVFRVGVYKKSLLVSSAGIRLCHLKTGIHNTVKIALIGGVATLPEYRGVGFASAALSFLTRWAQDQGVSFIALWGAEDSLYRKLGFELCGAQVRVPILSLGVDRVFESDLVTSGWDAEIFRLMRNRLSGLVLQEEDRTWVEGHKNVDWFSLKENNICIAYAAVGRGIDLAGIVHEWGGTQEGIRKIFRYLQDLHPTLEVLGAPIDLRALGFNLTNLNKEFLCRVKIVDATALLKAYDLSSRVSAQKIENGWLISQGTQISQYFTDCELTQFLLGSPSRSSNESRNELIPLSFWFWGLDAS